ncbi:MAG: hypothetical protein V4685_13435 [Bacteroidota bacterium]
MKIHPFLLLFLACIITGASANAQLITGYWKGKIDRKNVELKIIKHGDSITGTSYYYESPNNYSRYSIKGYFDSRDNSVVWWDDVLVEEKNSKRFLHGKTVAPYFSTADFNCPGGDKMYLDGKAALKDKEEQNRPVALQNSDTHTFNDEWDYVIDNYTLGANDPDLIDSIGKLAFTKPLPVEPTVAEAPSPKTATVTAVPKKKLPVPVIKKEPSVKPMPAPVKEPVAVAALTNEQKFITRRRQLMQEITISGDSIELRFYDNAEVDGDSIAIFLNNKLLYEHVRLSDKPYTIKLAVTNLEESNELVMVAENLGSIPPNTSLMVAVVEEKHYEARLESTEQSSAVIRFVKK